MEHKFVSAIRIFYSGEASHIPFAEVKYYGGESEIVRWANNEDYERIHKCMNAYTYIYDERGKRNFKEW
jgi:hypothetical protein